MLVGHAGAERTMREISFPNINRGGSPGWEIGFRRSGAGLTAHMQVRPPVAQAAAVASLLPAAAREFLRFAAC